MNTKTARLLFTGLCLCIIVGCQLSGLDALNGQVHTTTLLGPATIRGQAPGPELNAAPKIATPGKAMFSSVNQSSIPQRSISLAECIALALENGRVGDFFDGAGSSRSSSVTGIIAPVPPSRASDSIRVLALDPAIVGTDIEASLARFDVWSETNFFWNRTDQQSRFLFTPTAFEQLTNQSKVDGVNVDTGLYKRLATGGIAGMQLRNNYQYNFLGSNAQILDPAYRPAMEFSFEQPLLQGAGVWINQLRDFHPGGVRRNYSDAGQQPGIMLVRLTHKQTQLEFERQVQELLFRVEEAYWQLYCAYWDLYSSDNGMKQAHSAWQIAKSRFDAGGIGIEDMAMIEEQYHFFRNQRLQALGRGTPGRPGVLEAERRLRYLVGLPAEDGTRLSPADQPAFVLYDVNLEASVADAKAFRPELRQVAIEIEAAQLNIFKAEDRLRPDLRFVSRYNANGLGQDLGKGVDNLTNRPHHEWELGMRLQFPLGNRAASADMTQAKLQHAQRLAFLKDQEEKLLFSLQRSYQDMVQHREHYQVRQSQRKAAALQLQARYKKFEAGGDPKQPGAFIDLLLRAQRNWTDALREEFAALCSYRVAIADFERQKGTICQRDNVTIEQGPAPASATAGASRKLRDWRERRSHGVPSFESCLDPAEMSFADGRPALSRATTLSETIVEVQAPAELPMATLQAPLEPASPAELPNPAPRVLLGAPTIIQLNTDPATVEQPAPAPAR